METQQTVKLNPEQGMSGTRHETIMFYVDQPIFIQFNYYDENKIIEIAEILNENRESLMDGYLGDADSQEEIELHCWEYLESATVL